MLYSIRSENTLRNILYSINQGESHAHRKNQFMCHPHRQSGGHQLSSASHPERSGPYRRWGYQKLHQAFKSFWDFRVASPTLCSNSDLSSDIEKGSFQNYNFYSRGNNSFSNPNYKNVNSDIKKINDGDVFTKEEKRNESETQSCAIGLKPLLSSKQGRLSPNPWLVAF